MADSKIKCFSCGQKEMFHNQAGGMTCGKCGQLVFACSAEEHALMMNMLDDFQKALKKTEEVCAIQNKLIKVYQIQIKEGEKHGEKV